LSDPRPLVSGVGTANAFYLWESLIRSATQLAVNVIQICGIALRHDDFGEPGGMCGQHLLLQPADRKHPALQCDLARHANRALHGTAREQRRNRRDHRHPRARSVLRDGPGRHVHVNLTTVERP
jgi:hypothetical protein